MTRFSLPERTVSAVRMVFSVLLCASLIFYAYKSIHWRVICDPSIMHYVNFLMAHGLAPYRDIIDINLPGSYFMDGWAMSVFGGSDLSWRMYEFCLLAVLIGSMIVIAWPYDWFAGLCAGTVFTLTHAVEGARNAGQREELMLTLILIGYACLFQALRRQRPGLMVLFGVALGLATSLKPTAALLIVVLPAFAFPFMRRAGLRTWTWMAYAAAGFAAAMLLDVWFFWRYHAFHDFLVVSGRLVKYYAGIGNPPLSRLIKDLLNRRNLVVLVPAIVIAYVNRRRPERERLEANLLIIGILFGAISYIAQRKDFEHHLYAYFALLLLWGTIEWSRAWKSSTAWQRPVAVCLFALLILYRVPVATHLLSKNNPLDQQQLALGADFQKLGGKATLQHDILCFDVVQSCYGALYHAQILPYSNLVADYMLYPPAGYQPVTYYRQTLWNDLQQRVPRVIVVSDAWLCTDHSFNKMKEWPAMEKYIASNYDMVSFLDSGYGAYKLYVRKPGVNAVAAVQPAT